MNKLKPLDHYPMHWVRALRQAQADNGTAYTIESCEDQREADRMLEECQALRAGIRKFGTAEPGLELAVAECRLKFRVWPRFGDDRKIQVYIMSQLGQKKAHRTVKYSKKGLTA